MPKQVYSKSLGRMVWVDDDGNPINPASDPMGVNPGLGSLPGRALARERDLASRLPDAQLAGFRGPSVVDPRTMRGARPEEPEPKPVPTYRPLAGAKQNSRGNARVVDLAATAGFLASVDVGSIIETPRNCGDDAEDIRVICSFDVLKPTTGSAPGFIPSNTFAVFGTLEFGIGGASFSAEFDWLAGTSFAIPASFVRVKADIEYFTFKDAQIALSAALAYGGSVAGNFSPLRKTLYLGPIASQGGATPLADLPAFASAVTLSTNTIPPNLELVFNGNAKTVRYKFTNETNVANQRDGQFPIPGWATRFQVINRDPAPATFAFDVSAIFSLAL